MKRRAIVLAVLAAVVAGALLLGREPGPPEPPLPSVVAAVGDSITVAVAAGGGPWPHPSRSWSTGNDLSASHYERLVELGADPERHNLAVPGARMEDAVEQAARVVEAGADYVTVLMGANDVCHGTDLTSFERDTRAALARLIEDLPDIRVFVSSIPDIARLVELFGDDRRIIFRWRTFRMCPALLPDADVEDVHERVRAYNAVLERACDEHEACLYDESAVFDHPFTAADVSRIDFFHPSEEGQRKLAEITWRAGYWGRFAAGSATAANE
jgi:lysophospholipase L1-like esterase